MRPGKFYILEKYINYTQPLWSHIIPLRVEFLYSIGRFECYGISDMFEEKKDGQVPPLYNIIASKELDNNGEEYIDFYAEIVNESEAFKNNGLDILG